jgi:3-deoxy-D-manno-octulosonate 8-phosphate phosphatase (KDO 8-P phosphatase)
MNKLETKKNKPEIFILDVDGVMTDGKFYYSEKGKIFKIFSADDHDGLCLLKKYIKIIFVTGDKRGFKISEKRIVGDMKMDLELVSTTQRLNWFKERYDLNKIIYMGDGIFDHYVMKHVLYSIAPSNSDPNAMKNADYVTKRIGGDRAVAEASLHILDKFFKPYNPDKDLPSNLQASGTWAT